MRLFTVALPLVPLAAGEFVDRAAWPAHITLIGNFLGQDADEIEPIVERFASSTPPLQVVVEDEAWFGPDRTVLVDLVEVPVLRALHAQLLGELEAGVPELEMLLPLHARDGYRPHRTVTAGPRPLRGDTLSADRVSLAELDPAGRDGLAEILGIWPLSATSLGQEAHE